MQLPLSELHLRNERNPFESRTRSWVEGQNFCMEFTHLVSPADIESLTEEFYLQAFKQAYDFGYSHLIRVWNVIPDINSFYEGIENYQHFCSGRLKAFRQWNLIDTCFPAASAIGGRSQLLYCSFLFSKEPSLKVSNTLQEEAYRYPVAYGPTAPSFSRAAVHKNKIYVSGTAAIRGHQSQFPGNVLAQLDMTFENIQNVLRNGEQKSGHAFHISEMDLRVFLKNKNDLNQVQDRINKLFHPKKNVQFLEADICRKELLIEIEGVTHAIPNC